jgi:transposase-like protein
MLPEITSIQCPNCTSKNIKKAGIKKLQLQTHQKYHCKNCKKIFTLDQQSKNRTYPIKTILNALTLYNLGHSQTKIQTLLRISPKPSQKTISNWINEHEHLAPYKRIRKEAKKLYTPENIIDTYDFLHNNLNYKFQIHNYKLSIAFQNNKFNQHSKFIPIKEYLDKIPTKKFPHHIFKPNPNTPHTHQRASQSQFKTLNIQPRNKQNLANKLCQLALNLATSNKQRHETIQDFMLINDSTTIATEIPIYLTNDDLTYFINKGFKINHNEFQTPITGHIDFLQIRNNNIQILDYKPEANKETPIKQLTIYALALASRTKLDLKSFKCAWFDQKNYFEFFPLHTVYKKYSVLSNKK